MQPWLGDHLLSVAVELQRIFRDVVVSVKGHVDGLDVPGLVLDLQLNHLSLYGNAIRRHTTPILQAFRSNNFFNVSLISTYSNRSNADELGPTRTLEQPFIIPLTAWRERMDHHADANSQTSRLCTDDG